MASKKWTIAFIMVTDGLQWFEYNDIEQSILNVLQPKEVEPNNNYILFFFDLKLSVSYAKKLKIKNGVWIFDYSKSCILKSEVKESINNFLKNELTNDERLMIINFGHGAGLGFFPELTNRCSFDQNPQVNRDVINAIAYLKTNFLLNLNKKNALNQTVLKLLKDSSEHIFILSANELAGIFSKALGERKIDILINVNCYTQMIEVGYEFLGLADYIISPQTQIPFSGYNYEDLFSFIENHPDCSSENIAKQCILGYAKKYSGCFINNYKNRYIFDHDAVSFSIIALNEYYSKIILLIEDLAKYLLTKLNNSPGDSTKAAIKKARKTCETFSPGNEIGSIDLEFFILNLKILMKEQKIDNFYDDFFALKQLINIETLLASNASYAPSQSLLPIEGKFNSPLGLSIFYPEENSNKPLFEILKQLYRETGFTSANLQNWKTLLIKLGVL